MKRILLTILTVLSVLMNYGQDVRQELRQDPHRAAGILMTYPTADNVVYKQAPEGKKPFYINHYGAQGSYYYEDPELYALPLRSLMTADSLGKLTPLGRDVLRRLSLINQDAHMRWGEISEQGAQQQRSIIRRMFFNNPDIFVDGVNASARSSTATRSILSMEHALLQLALLKPMEIRHKATFHHQYYINPQDKELADKRMDAATTAHFAAFAEKHSCDSRQLNALFSDSAYVSRNVDTAQFCDRLFKVAVGIQNTFLADSITLFDLYTQEELYQKWKVQNAWWYINRGGCTLNGGTQPFMQRVPLRKMIQMGDSIATLTFPVVHLRYTHEHVILSLACLLELNGYGLATNDLESLEEKGWVNYRIAPMSSNIQMIHYRSGPADDDILVKVLLNEREATLPVTTDCAPYYHWKDVRAYYLKKLDAYEE